MQNLQGIKVRRSLYRSPKNRTQKCSSSASISGMWVRQLSVEDEFEEKISKVEVE